MASASLKITLRDGTTERFSESVGKETVDYEVMDKALHRLQEQSNAFLTVLVEKEKGMNLTSESNGGDNDNDDEEESSDDEENGDENNDQDKPPEKKPKL